MAEFFINFVSSNTFETILTTCVAVLTIDALILLGFVCHMLLGSEEDINHSTLQKFLIYSFAWSTLLAIVTVCVLALTKALVFLFLM